MKTIHIINGPNLNLLGRREVEIYGSVSFEDYLVDLAKRYEHIDLQYFQSNHEGAIIDKLQEVGFQKDTGIVLNAAGYTHTSIALGDTVAGIENPVVEVHISDIMSREDFRHFSYIKAQAAHFISGQGLKGYDQAIDFLISMK